MSKGNPAMKCWVFFFLMSGALFFWKAPAERRQSHDLSGDVQSLIRQKSSGTDSRTASVCPKAEYSEFDHLVSRV